MTPFSPGRRRPAHSRSITMNRENGEKDLTQRARGKDMRARWTFGTMMMASVLAVAGGARGQEMAMPAQEQHHQMQMTVVKPEYPRMGRAQENAKGALVTLEQVQKIAGESNPTLPPGHASNNRASIRIRHWLTPEMKFAAAPWAEESRDSLSNKRW